MDVVQAELRAAISAVRSVKQNMGNVQQKIHTAFIAHGQLDGSLRAAQDELRTSQIAFGLLEMMLRDAQNATEEQTVRSSEDDHVLRVQMAFTLAEKTRILAQKTYAETYVRVQDAEMAIKAHKAALAKG
jgi:hypothetical protein